MKKKYVLAIGAILLIGIFLVIAAISRARTQSAVSPVITPVANNTRPSPTPNKINVANFSHQSENGYTLYYPRTWVENRNEMSTKKGIVYLLQPQDLSQPSHPHITVEVVDAKLDSIEGMTAEYSIFGYKKTDVVFTGVQATKYQRTLPSEQGTIHSTAYIYEKNSTIYLFKLGYTQEAEDSALEAEFTQLVTIFSPH